MDDGSLPGDPRARSRARRGTAHGRLLDAASTLLARATFDDLTAFVTVGRLTAESGLSNGAVYSAFEAAAGRSAPQQAARSALLSLGPEDDQMVVQILEQVHASLEAEDGSDERFIEALAELAAGPVVDSARGDALSDYTHVWLAAAVARNDDEVKAAGRRLFDDGTASYERMLARILELSGRTLAEGIDLTTFASVLMAGADGLAVRLRFDDRADGDVVRVAFLSAFASMTRRIDEADDLFAGRVVASGNVRAHDDVRGTVGDAVRSLVDREGWGAVSIRRVIGLTGIAETTVVAAFPTRHHLATLVWTDVLAMVERRARSRRTLPVETQVLELVADLAEAACDRRSLVASALTARLHVAATAGGDDLDPASVRLVDLLSELLDGGDGSSAVAARTAFDALLMGAASSDSPADELARVLVAGLRSIRPASSDS